MNLKTDKNNKAVYTYLGKDYFIKEIKIIGEMIDIKSSDGKLFAINNNEENKEVLKKTHTECFI